MTSAPRFLFSDGHLGLLTQDFTLLMPRIPCHRFEPFKLDPWRALSFLFLPAIVPNVIRELIGLNPGINDSVAFGKGQREEHQMDLFTSTLTESYYL